MVWIARPPAHTEMTTACLTTKTTDELPIPPLIFLMENPSDAVTDLFKRINIEEIVKKAVLGTWKWLFTPETAPTHVKSITVAVNAIDNLQMSPPSKMKNNNLFVYLTNSFIKETQEQYGVDDGLVIQSLIVHEIAFWLLHRRLNDDSYPTQFCRGFADYVRIKEGLFPSHHDTTTTEVIWYGIDTMPYFLSWLEEKYGEGTVPWLYAAMEAPYDNGVFEKILGTPISSLWKMYCVSIGEDEREQEELNRQLQALWPIPNLTCCEVVDGAEHELEDHISKKIVEELTKAVLAVLNHLYTPRTTPVSERLKEFRVVMKSGMTKWCSREKKDSCWEFAFSWEKFCSKEIEAKDMIERAIVFVATAFNLFWLENETYASWPVELGRAMSGFVLIKEGILPPTLDEVNPGTSRRYNFSLQTAYFLSQIEGTVGEGTIRRLHKYMMTNKYNPSLHLGGNPRKTFNRLRNSHDARLTESTAFVGMGVISEHLSLLRQPRSSLPRFMAIELDGQFVIFQARRKNPKCITDQSRTKGNEKE